ncbi:glycosyltransferase [Halovenus marina]|uniref:glycosyltransferase n=1 Tax=Halovenus marina TaxID=3396621 RepID=UPI003F57BC5D
MAPSIGLVVPAYDPDIDQLDAYVHGIAEELDPEVIRIELDGCESVPAEIASLPAQISAVPYRRGKGAAITAGFEALDTDVLAFADADGATPPASLRGVIEAITEGEADLAVGSRRHPDADVQSHQTVARRYMGDTFAWLARRFLDVDLHDYQCGAKAITAEGWDAVREHLYESGFAWDIELIAIAGALDLRVAEVPVTWHDQPGSTVSTIRTPLRFMRTLFVARHRAKQLHNSRLHAAIAQHRTDSAALVEEK